MLADFPVQCIGGRAPRSLDALLGGLLQKLIAAVPDAARVAMFNLLGQEGFPSVNISAQDKVAFINKAMRCALEKRCKLEAYVQ